MERQIIEPGTAANSDTHGTLEINVPGMEGSDLNTRLETFLELLNSYGPIFMTVYVNGDVKDVLVSWDNSEGGFVFEEKVYP